LFGIILSQKRKHFKMKKNTLNYCNILIFLMFFSLKITAQNYPIGHTTVSFIDISRSNRVIDTEIYYPANSAGNNVTINNSTTEKFPSLVFGHGFVMTYDAYQNIWENLVPKGFIFAIPKSEGSFSPSHTEYAKDLAFLINQMNAQNLLVTSIFYNKVSTQNAVMGHSMGGGAAFLSIQYNPNIKAILTLAAAETTPSAIAAAANISIPSLTFAGGNDCVAPKVSHQRPMFVGLNSSSCKTYISINGGSHCQMANSNFNCSFGETTCTPAPTITRAEQQTIMNDFAVKWLQAQLKNDCVAGAAFNALLVSHPGVIYIANCNQCDALSTNSPVNESFNIYPNPFFDVLIIQNSDNSNLQINIYDSVSRLILQQEFKNNVSIDTSKLTNGLYFYEIKKDNKILKKALIIKK
jgi:predicted dienelactone hydrolase